MTPDIFTPSADIYHQGKGATIIHGDATKLADYLEPESVDLIITSPPYFALRSYQDDGEHYDGQIGSDAA
jgi:DNA modification methylase